VGKRPCTKITQGNTQTVVIPQCADSGQKIRIPSHRTKGSNTERKINEQTDLGTSGLLDEDHWMMEVYLNPE
jgi:hypothetical protein